MIKTISRQEFRKLKSILKPYFEHLRDHSESLITRFYGLHLIKWRTGEVRHKKYLVVMNNIF